MTGCGQSDRLRHGHLRWQRFMATLVVGRRAWSFRQQEIVLFEYFSWRIPAGHLADIFRQIKITEAQDIFGIHTVCPSERFYRFSAMNLIGFTICSLRIFKNFLRTGGIFVSRSSSDVHASDFVIFLREIVKPMFFVIAMIGLKNKTQHAINFIPKYFSCRRRRKMSWA